MWKRYAGLAVLLAIAWATLRPMPEPAVPPPSCFLCGPRAVADAVLNLVLFLPVGVLLGSGLGAVPTVLIGAVLSAGIEGAQLLIPGRDPNLSDVLFNTLGAAAGVALVRMRGRWLVPGPKLGDGLAAGWTALVIAAVFLTGWLLEPVLAPPPYTVQWTPALEGMARYGGRVADAVVGAAPLRPGPAAGAERWAELLARGTPIAALTLLGPPPERLAPLLTIHDRSGAEGILLGVRGTDVVYRRQLRAHRWHLDTPELKARGVLHDAAPGDTVLIATVATPLGQCFIVRRVSHCGLGPNAGDGWRLLYSGDSFPEQRGRALNALWLGLLVLPIGFWSRWRMGLAMLALVAWYAWIRVPVDTILRPIGWGEGAGLALGFAAGVLLSRAIHRALRMPGATGAP